MRKILATALGVALALTATVALAGRNSSGTMSFTSVAGGYPYVSGQTISSSGVNANFAEIVTELGDSLSRSGKGGMTAPLRCADGTAALPAFSWTQDTNTGIYRIGADNIGVSLGGTKKVDLASGLTAFTDPVSFAGSTTTTGIARHAGAVYFDAAASFAASATFLSSVTVPTPQAGTDAASKDYVDGSTTTTAAGTGWTVASGELYKSGKMVHLDLGAQAGVGAAWASIVVIPAGWRPASIVYISGHVYDSSVTTAHAGYYRLGTDGVLYLDTYGAPINTPFTIGSGDLVTLSATWYATQ